jgi:hypothetical protein
MDPIKTSAEFAAYVWYTNGTEGNPEVVKKGKQFSKDNWVTFLPLAHEGLGRLLIEIGKAGKERRHKARPKWRPKRAGKQLIAHVC